MLSTRFKYNFITGFLLLFLVVPFFIITQYTQLSADDYCRCNTSLTNYFSNIYQWYLGHNGRFINAMWSLLPIYSLSIYRVILLFLMILFGLAINYFIGGLNHFYGCVLKAYEIRLMTVLMYILIISLLPDIYEFFYWLAGATAYLISIITVLFFMGYLFKNKLYIERKNFLSLALCVILIQGNNEFLIPFISLILIALTTYNFICLKSNLKWIIFLNILNLCVVAIVVFSPGSLHRQTFYPQGGEILHSIFQSFLSAGMFSLKSIIEIPYILIYPILGFFLFSRPLPSSINLKIINPYALFVTSFISFTAVLFVPWYAVGHLTVNQGRIGNMVHIIFLILLLVNIVNLAFYLKNRVQIASPKWVQPILSLGFILSVVFISVRNKNYGSLWMDWNNSELERFSADFKTRIDILESASDKIIELPPIHNTHLLKHYGLTDNPKAWENQCYLDAINKQLDSNFTALTLITN